MKWNRLLSFVGIFAFGILANAQAYELPVSTDNSQEIVEKAARGIDYSDEFSSKPKKEKADKKKEEDKKEKKREAVDFSSLGSGTLLILQILAIALLLFLLAFIIYQIIKSQKTVKNAKYDKLSLDFAKKDLQIKLEQELGEGDYRLACRTLFLQLLQEFVNRRMIIWRNEKTNWNYYQESKGKIGQQEPQLKDVTLAYDVLWYGEQEPSLTEFKNFKNQINQLLNG